ncbi:MAG: serine/threonine-protein phosphatase, partial [Actinomycetia bacterium]|nr:serine/threonine-protein phosphatase [Actinomycetes bacterium]
YSLRLVVEENPEQRQKLRGTLRRAMSQMSEAQTSLTIGDTERGLPKPSDAVKKIYFNRPINLNKQVLNYLMTTKELVDSPDSQIAKRDKKLELILVASSSRLLQSLNMVVEEYQIESERTIASLQIVLVGIIATILLTLMIEALFIFRPMSKRISDESQQLETAFDEEVIIAETLQKSLVPKESPSVDGLEVEYVYQSATNRAIVGGDFYDHFNVADGKWVFFIGDVEGHGIVDAAETARVKALLRDRATTGMAPSEVVSSVNDSLFRQGAERFTVLTYLVFDQATSSLSLVNAANPYPYFTNGDRFIETTGTPLGLVGANQKYPCVELQLSKGDTLIVHSDGLNEARVEGDHKQFGQERVRDFIKANPNMDLAELLKGLVEQARLFSKNNLTDDVLIFGLRKTTSSESTPKK